MTPSRRIAALADLVPPSGCVADIGCDHGQLGALLLERRKAGRVVACDISAPSLAKARALLAPYGKGAACRLSDGLAALDPGEADTIVVAGMGAMEIIRILQKDEQVARGSTLVLGPHRNTSRLRAFLLDAGYAIERERAVRDRGHCYNLLVASVQQMRPPYSPIEIEVGRFAPQDWDGDALAALEKRRREAVAASDALARSGADEQRRRELCALADSITSLLQERATPTDTWTD